MLKTLRGKLGNNGEKLSVVFLSIDPERDRPDQLASYVHYFNPAFVGVTAAEPELGRFTQGLGIAYAKVAGPTPESYAMDHSAALVLINPQAQIAGYFSPPYVVDALSIDLGRLMGAS
jgi:protein SCO1/2